MHLYQGIFFCEFFATILFDCWTMMNSYNWRFLDLTYLLMCDKILHFFFYTNVIVLTLLGIVFSIFVKFRWILYGTFWWTCLWRKFNWVRGWRKMVANTSKELTLYPQVINSLLYIFSVAYRMLATPVQKLYLLSLKPSHDVWLLMDFF